MSQEIARIVCEGFYVPGKAYPQKLPPQLSNWYAYCSDAGHSIVCCLKEDYRPGVDLTQYLLPVSVKTVLKGYEVKQGYVVVDLPYSPELGLVTSEEDYEF